MPLGGFVTVRDFIDLLSTNPWILVAVLLLPPLLTGIVGLLHGRADGAQTPWRYLYALLVYWTCIPGIFAAVLTAYSLFFVHENLLQANVLIYFLPIAAMLVTLVLIGKQASIQNLPGFDRLSGLMVMLAVSFVLALAIEKTRLFLFFGAPVATLVLVAAFLFALLKWGSYMLFRRQSEPKIDPPRWPKH